MVFQKYRHFLIVFEILTVELKLKKERVGCLEGSEKIGKGEKRGVSLKGKGEGGEKS
jgi:hypothetical protein